VTRCRKDLICGAGRGRPRVWLQVKGGGLKPGQAPVLLPLKDGETSESPAAYIAPLRQVLIDKNTGHVNSTRDAARRSPYAMRGVLRRLIPEEHRARTARKSKQSLLRGE
jgi:hypothetical protein